MPYSRPNPGIYLDALGPLVHNQPLAQVGLVGITVKQRGAAWSDNLAAQSAIKTGEEFLLITKGVVEVADPGGATLDAPVYITGTNTLSLSTGTNEVQTVTVAPATSDGTYTLTFSGQTTGAIAFDANATAVQAALVALSNVAPGDVVVTGGPGATAALVVTFGGAYLDVNVPQMTADSTSLVGGTATVATQTGGVAFTKFGRVVEVTAGKRGVGTGRMRVDLDARDSF